MKFFKEHKVISAFLLLILVLVLFMAPLANLLMFFNPPSWLSPAEGISNNAIWIGFIATFYGAIIGGTISGLFTYLGVAKTIDEQRKSLINSWKSTNRILISVSEVSGVNLDLSNVYSRESSRLIITKEYDTALSNNMSETFFNFIEITNPGEVMTRNCKLDLSLKFIDSNEFYSIDVAIPTINKREKIFILADPVPDSRSYTIDKIILTYETIANEKMKLERINLNDKIAYIYYKENEAGKYEHYLEVSASNTRWTLIN